MSAETVAERQTRLRQRIEDGGVLGLDAHDEIVDERVILAFNEALELAARMAYRAGADDLSEQIRTRKKAGTP